MTSFIRRARLPAAGRTRRLTDIRAKLHLAADVVLQVELRGPPPQDLTLTGTPRIVEQDAKAGRKVLTEHGNQTESAAACGARRSIADHEREGRQGRGVHVVPV